jgi:hypothetical protein
MRISPMLRNFILGFKRITARREAKLILTVCFRYSVLDASL